MKNLENIGKYVTRLKMVTNEMKINGKALNDVRVIKKFYVHQHENFIMLLQQSMSQKIYLQFQLISL